MGGEATDMYPVYVKLKDLNIWEIGVLEQVVQMEVSTEEGPLAVQGNNAAVGDVDDSYGHMKRVKITEKRTFVGGWHICHEPGDYRR